MKINPNQLHPIRPLKPGNATEQQQIDSAREVRKTFQTFVGESFFGQMLKSMRSTLDKPAYFHGGRAEEVFRGQLDQTLAQEMTKSSADQISDPMFRNQFPREAKILERVEKQEQPAMADLLQLRRF